MHNVLTGEAMLKLLLNTGIIHTISEDKYVLTGKVKKVVDSLDTGLNNLDIPTPKKVTLDGLFPKEIRDAAPDKKIPAIYNYCKIPTSILRNGRRYMVRSNDVSTRAYLNKFMKLPNIKPELFLTCITDYYRLMEYPKSMKNFIKDGDLQNLYEDYLEGKYLYTGGKKDNKVWR